MVAKVEAPNTVKVLLTLRFSTAKLVKSISRLEKSSVRVLPPEMLKVMVLFALKAEAARVGLSSDGSKFQTPPPKLK